VTGFFDLSVRSGAVGGCGDFKDAAEVDQFLDEGVPIRKTVNVVVFELVEVSVRSFAHQDGKDLCGL